MREIQLLATAATLKSQKRLHPPPFAVLGLLSCCNAGNADLSIAVAEDVVRVTFAFQSAPANWPLELLSRCVVPSIFCFGELHLAAEGRVWRIAPGEFLSGESAATQILAEDVGQSDSNWLAVSFARECKCWLHLKDLEEAIRCRTWAGAPADHARREVRVQCLANRSIVRQPALDRHAIKEVVAIDGATVIMQACVRPRVGGDPGRIRHIGTGSLVATSLLAKLPKDVSIDVDFEIAFGNESYGMPDGVGCFELARGVIAQWTQALVNGDACNRCVERSESARAAAALDKLESRRAALMSCEYVCYQRRQLYRVPTNENQLVALFLKLEACGALPFKAKVLEYTPKTGIDAIGHFVLTSGGIREMFVPIEFENEFGSFITHGHPVSHTKLIVCWSAGDSQGRRLQASSVGSWLKYYVAGGFRVPVVVVSMLPDIDVKKFHDEDFRT